MSTSGPVQLKGSCILSALNVPIRGTLNEQRARTLVQQDPNNFIPQTYYEDANLGVSQRLRSVEQSGGGLMPVANPFIGAPMSTFVYGNLAPSTPHPQLD